MFEAWKLNQPNEIKFVLVDAGGNEVIGLGSAFTLQISKPGDEAFAVGVGTKSELGSGWYRYVATAEESNEFGTVAIVVTGAGAVQQNLVYEVETEFDAEAVWEYDIRTLTSPTGQSQGPITIPAVTWNPP